MERDKSNEVDHLTSELHEIARGHLEEPDFLYTNLNYNFDLPEGYFARLESTKSTDARNANEVEHKTAVFVYYTVETGDETVCGHKIAFSVINDHLANRLSGVQPISPANMPNQAFHSSNQQESIVLREVLALAEQTYGHRDLGSDKAYFRDLYKIGVDQLVGELQTTLSDFSEAANHLLPFGAYTQHRSKCVSGGDKQLRIESVSISGEDRHIPAPYRDRPRLAVKTTVDDMLHSFEELDDGTFEIKTVIADPCERYKDFRTFRPSSYNKAGKVTGFGLNMSEVLEKEAEARALGLLVPTAEKLQLFLEPLREAA